MRRLPLLHLLLLGPACGDAPSPELAACYDRARHEAERRAEAPFIETRLRAECDRHYPR